MTIKNSLQKFSLITILLSNSIFAQQEIKTEIKFEPKENWWGGFVAFGSQMPYSDTKEYNLSSQNFNNQVVPFFLSTNGRYFWSDKPFNFHIDNKNILLTSNFEKISVKQSGADLKSAFLEASKNHFPANGIVPNELFFSMPQYNTWIELMYNQNQADIINYAQNIVSNNFPEGVLMIDDNWQKYYGNFEFKPDKFSDPKGMISKLHSMGFKIILWISPFVSPDSPEYRDLEQKVYLIKQKGTNSPAIIEWWNGKSACFDLTNPDAKNYFVNQLKKMQHDYGIDGFKFDAGDNSFYDPNFIDSFNKEAISVDHTKAWAEIGLEFPFNEYRAGWEMGGKPLVQRLGDKAYSWKAVQSLIPDMITAGLLGYAYTCPDMIGGGSFTTFLNVKENEFDQKLIVRSAQVHALMPMMQFSVAPWRILNKENLEIVKKSAELHKKFGPYILVYAKKSSQTGEPIIRHMEYEFPHQGFETIKDQFMLGEKYLVAPIVTSDDNRKVVLPIGIWKDDLGKLHNGNQTIDIIVPINRLPYFERIK
jgi:alpha-glucosidase (family GH31 glycosyl hydrolase)